MKFEIQFANHVTIEADSFEGARQKFTDQFPIPVTATSFYEIESNVNKDVVGYCEISELPIFEDDEFGFDEEGIMWLKREEDK